MKKLFYFVLLVCAVTLVKAQTTEVHIELGQAWGGGTSVDVNNDGHLDFYISGKKNNPQEPLLDEDGVPLDLADDGKVDTTERWQRMYFYNPSSGNMEAVTTSLRLVDRTNMDWADVDNDGLLDVLALEHSYDFYHGGVYKNNGDGLFTKLDWPVPAKANAGAFADFNNDGHLDYVCIATELNTSGVYINNGDNTFTLTNTDIFGEYVYGLGYLEVLDYNNDGFADVLVTANCDNPEANDNARVITDIFINYDEEPGNFYRAYLGKSATNDAGTIFQKGNGGVDIADFNSDGWLDIALHGEGGAGTIEQQDGDWTCISHVYLNQKDGTYADKPQAAFQADLRPLNSTGAGTAAYDWNNDGNYDLFITGWNPPTVNTQAGYLYSGDGAGNFTEVGRVPGGSETIILFNDWNDDGVLDYLVSGHSWDGMFYPEEADKGRTAAVMFNENGSNLPPAAPSGLTATVDGSNVILSWNEATDDKTPAKSLSYEYYLKNSAGEFMIAPASFVGGDKDGVRKLVKTGNCFLNKSAKLKGLADGQYTWGVQAIDASYQGSAFANGTFTIGESGINSFVSNIADVYSYNNTIFVKGLTLNSASLSVYNIVGQEVINTEITADFAGQLPAGVYLVKLSAEQGVQVTKVMIR
ncbi:MAG: T9SS type A sorting domain-containing protein [Bacteroidota bacterium]